MRDTYKNQDKLVDIVTAGSQKITLWGPQRTPLGILRVNLVDRAFHQVAKTEGTGELKGNNKLIKEALCCVCTSV